MGEDRPPRWAVMLACRRIAGPDLNQPAPGDRINGEVANSHLASGCFTQARNGGHLLFGMCQSDA